MAKEKAKSHAANPEPPNFDEYFSKTSDFNLLYVSFNLLYEFLS